MATEQDDLSPAILEALRRDLWSFATQLRDSEQLPLRLLEIELWDRLARRLHHRPRVDFAALEYAQHLLAGMIDELPAVGGYPRVQMRADRAPLSLPSWRRLPAVRI